MFNLNTLARKTHRVFALTTTILSLFMVPTGLAMKYPKIFNFPVAPVARYVHNYVSPLFAASLGSMLLTGIFMIAYPLLRRYFAKPHELS